MKRVQHGTPQEIEILKWHEAPKTNIPTLSLTNTQRDLLHQFLSGAHPIVMEWPMVIIKTIKRERSLATKAAARL